MALERVAVVVAVVVLSDREAAIESTYFELVQLELNHQLQLRVIKRC